MANYRHGDLALISVKELPEGVKQDKSKMLLEGKSNKHYYDNGEFYPKKDELIVGYLVAKNTTLSHKEHGRKIKGKDLKQAKIKNGVYELRVQHEETNEGMKQVED